VDLGDRLAVSQHDQRFPALDRVEKRGRPAAEIGERNGFHQCRLRISLHARNVKHEKRQNCTVPYILRQDAGKSLAHAAFRAARSEAFHLNLPADKVLAELTARLKEKRHA